MTPLRTVVPLAVALGLSGALVAGCGGGSSADTPGPSGTAPGGSAAPASVPSATSAAPAAAAAPADVCALVDPAQVQAVLGSTPNATNEPQPSAAGVTAARCVWDAGTADLSVTVITADPSEPTAVLLLQQPVEGDAVAGIGDRAGVVKTGDFDVEVDSVAGQQRVQVSASAIGVVARTDAVLDVARTVADRLG